MSLLRKTRTELAGAWRSLRYDLGRRPAEPSAGGPDVTSTGMCTFGGADLQAEALRTPRAEALRTPGAVRAPRRAVAVTVFGALTVAGATGAYLGVVNGLGSLVSESEAATVPSPPTATAQAQLGRGPSAVRRVVAPSPSVTTAAAPLPGTVTTPVRPAPPAVTTPATRTTKSRPVRTTKPARPLGNPPVPTPTAPASSPSPTPSTTPSGHGSASPSESSATPSESAEPSASVQPRHRHRR